MKKALIIGLGVIVVIITLPIIFLKLAFGPLNESGSIDLGEGCELLYDETYIGDFADSFYDIKLVLKTANGQTFSMGNMTLHEYKWREKITPIHIRRWLILPLGDKQTVVVKIIDIITGQLYESTLVPSNLCGDPIYSQKHRDCPDNIYEGSSTIRDITGNTLDVNYEYKIHAEHPSKILVEQRIVYAIDPASGMLRMKKIYERIVQ